jgi:type II secretory pathway pseudopilin PulG
MTEQRGIALIELLIGIAVSAGLITFVLPTVRAAHDANRQSGRFDRVGQITLSQISLSQFAVQHQSQNSIHRVVTPSVMKAIGPIVTLFRANSVPTVFRRSVSFAHLLIDRQRFSSSLSGARADRL